MSIIHFVAVEATNVDDPMNIVGGVLPLRSSVGIIIVCCSSIQQLFQYYF
jgi:hypothetical protein